MKYKSFIIISSLLCVTNAFDMKYSLQKHEWNTHIPGLVADDTIDNFNRLTYHRSTEEKVSLNSTYLAGGVTLSDSYALVANFEIREIVSSCLFSIERKDKRKLALCLEPAGEDAVTITLYSANIPKGKMSFGYQILKKTWTELILAVNETDIALLADCKIYGTAHVKSDISKTIHLTDDMAISVGFPLTPGKKFEATIQDLDLYSPTDATTITSLCPDLHSSQFRGETGEKGEKGDRGPQGETGSKGEPSEYGLGLPGVPGVPGLMGLTGLKGRKGDPGFPGMDGRQGEKGSCACPADVSSLLESMPELRGPPGPMGHVGLPGLPGYDGPQGITGLPGLKGAKGESVFGPEGRKGQKGEPGVSGPPGPSCPATNISPASTDEHDALKAIASGMKILTEHITEKTEQLKLLTEHITKSNERMANAEQNIEALKNAMLAESQL